MPRFVTRDADGLINRVWKTDPPEVTTERIDDADEEIAVFYSHADVNTRLHRLIKALVKKGIVTRQEIRAEATGRDI